MSRYNRNTKRACVGICIVLAVLAACSSGDTPNSASTPQPTATTEPVRIVVNTALDDRQGCPERCTLRHAIDIANSGDEVVISDDVTEPLELAQPITINKPITITGRTDRTIINATGLENIFILEQDVTLNNLSLRGSKTAVSVVMLDSNNATLNNIEITQARMGINQQAGSVSINNSVLHDIQIVVGYRSGSGPLAIINTEISNAEMLIHMTNSGNTKGNDQIQITDSVISHIEPSEHSWGSGVPSFLAISLTFNGHGDVTILRTVFQNNSRGISITGNCDFQIIDSRFEGNEINDGSLIVPYCETVHIEGSTFVRNVAGNNHAMIILSNQSGSLEIVNSTFTRNRGGEKGGAIFVDHGENVTIRFSTFTRNSSTTTSRFASTSGGAIYVSPRYGEPTLLANIFADNHADSGPDVFGRVNSLGFNVISNKADSVGWFASDLTDIDDLLLGDLGDNGGFAPTIPLLEGSSLLGLVSENCPATDQRGEPRQTPCDVGAFELNE